MFNNFNIKDKLKSIFSKEHLKIIFQGLAVAIVTAAVFFCGYFTHYFSLNEELKSIDFFLDIYKTHYYNPSDVNPVDVLAEGLMDIYSDYFTAEEYVAYQKEGQGSKSGFGIGISALKITTVLGNSPAEKVGIKTGGKIVAFKLAEGTDFTLCENQTQLTDFLGSVNGAVSLKIQYGEAVKEFTLTKAEFTENYVFYTDSTGSYRYNGEGNKMLLTEYEGERINLQGGWGYLKLTQFNGLADGTMGGAGQFAGALELFKENGNKKLIIDLRGNGGGYISILANMASHLCDTNSNEKFICQKARYSDGSTSDFYAPVSRYTDYSFESIVFLVDSNSASASEALVGAVLDYDKSSNNNIVKVVVEPTELNGEKVYKSYGKGIMQSFYVNPLTGEAVKLTTAEVIWPISSTCIHNIGLTPTVDSRIFANTFGDAIEYAQTL